MSNVVINYELLKSEDISFMREHIEMDGQYCAKKLQEFLNAPNTYGFVAKAKCDASIPCDIVGFAYGYYLTQPYTGANDFFIYSVGVMESWQNRGIGSGLIEYIKKFAFEKLNCQEMFVLTDKGNPRACHVYEKCGFENEWGNSDGICYVIYNKAHDKREKPKSFYGE